MNSKDHDAAFAAVRAALMASYAGTLASSRMTPIEALECMAAALGSVYREVADSHVDPHGCNCGWLPNERFDIIALEQAITVNAASEEETALVDLRSMLPVGHG